MKQRIMYIESKAGGLTGPARIGRVTFSKSGATLYYGQKAFRSLKGVGFKSNYYEVETGEHYWISGPRKDGNDALYATHTRPVVDEDVRDAYWSEIRRVAAPRRQPQQHPQHSPAQQ
ncbi:1-deoxy-D-xylulose-5-phosphate synthase [Variovorax sp. KBW07]|uniref:1-deoxy-D-xylulose-5-phosphate synthase n=1 Tax=Variovorax sp. KBW07 TaxID=2153358 RepID=UPI001C8AD9B1|nr:1-deoxy-D-xylulose-5-phosphate synthase [Variovorax sp. KBW07]